MGNNILLDLGISDAEASLLTLEVAPGCERKGGILLEGPN